MSSQRKEYANQILTLPSTQVHIIKIPKTKSGGRFQLDKRRVTKRRLILYHQCVLMVMRKCVYISYS